MKIEPCVGCGRMILTERMAGLTIKCDPTPLTDVGDIVRLLTHPNPPSLWVVEKNQQGQPVRLRGARPGELGPVPEHRCQERFSGSLPASPGGRRPESPVTPPKALQGPPAAPSTPSSAPRRERSSAQPVGSALSERLNRVGEGPVCPAERGPAVLCDGCSQPCADGTYASVQLGELTIWAQHVTECPL